MTKYCAYVSGEHVGLAVAEVQALSRLLPSSASVSWAGRLVRIDCRLNPVEFLLGRAALIQEAGTVVVEAVDLRELSSKVSETVLSEHISGQQSFAVRLLPLTRGVNQESRLHIERELGEAIERATGARVSLKTPEVFFRVFASSEGLLLSKSVASPLRPALRKREPGKKTFFHPSMMNATLSRAMCNLAGVLPGYSVLDPFCGGGGILCEVAHIGARPVGLDLNWAMLMGAEQNLSGITTEFGLVQGDAREPPTTSCDCLVTDPPYGRASSTRGAKVRELLLRLMGNLEILVKGSGERVCICGAESMNLQGIVMESGFRVGTSVSISVHSGLVREVVTVSL